MAFIFKLSSGNIKEASCVRTFTFSSVSLFLKRWWAVLSSVACRSFHDSCSRLSLPNRIIGDALGPDWPHYSGRFDVRDISLRAWVDGRPIYYDTTGTIRLAYCNKEHAWAFSFVTEGHCDYFIRSTTTKGFDVITQASMPWYAGTPGGSNDVPIDWLAIECNECSTDRCDPDHGYCSDEGICVCYNDTRILDGEEVDYPRLGLNCESPFPSCDFYSLDLRTKGAISSIAGAAIRPDKEFTSLTLTTSSLGPGTIKMNGRLVYVPFVFIDNDADDSFDFIDSIIIFTGTYFMKKRNANIFSTNEFFSRCR